MLSGLHFPYPPSTPSSPFFFSMYKEVVLQEEISRLSETRVIPLNKRAYVRGKTGAVLMEEIAVKLSPNGEKTSNYWVI